MAAIARSSNEE